MRRLNGLKRAPGSTWRRTRPAGHNPCAAMLEALSRHRSSVRSLKLVEWENNDIPLEGMK
jgi:hypothetical protein